MMLNLMTATTRKMLVDFSAIDADCLILLACETCYGIERHAVLNR